MSKPLINLTILRRKKHLTQEELGKMSNLSRVTINRIENGAQSPSLDAIVSIAYALDSTVDFLLRGDING